MSPTTNELIPKLNSLEKTCFNNRQGEIIAEIKKQKEWKKLFSLRDGIQNQIELMIKAELMSLEDMCSGQSKSFRQSIRGQNSELAMTRVLKNLFLGGVSEGYQIRVKDSVQSLFYSHNKIPYCIYTYHIFDNTSDNASQERDSRQELFFGILIPENSFDNTFPILSKEAYDKNKIGIGIEEISKWNPKEMESIIPYWLSVNDTGYFVFMDFTEMEDSQQITQILKEAEGLPIGP